MAKLSTIAASQGYSATSVGAQSPANVLITGGRVTANVTSSNAIITGGTISGVTSITATTITATNFIGNGSQITNAGISAGKAIALASVFS